jgi:hypothetical protein
MSGVRAAMVGLGMVLAFSRTAAADATAFIGVTPTPEARFARGFSVGAGLLVLGFEFEYAKSSGDEESLVPSLATYSGNLLLQTPFPIFGLQPYATAGAGVYREAFAGDTETGLGLNTGAGVKVTLAGPLRVRVDYRVFRLGGGALYSPAHRVYAGLNLAF